MNGLILLLFLLGGQLLFLFACKVRIRLEQIVGGAHSGMIVCVGPSSGTLLLLTIDCS